MARSLLSSTGEGEPVSTAMGAALGRVAMHAKRVTSGKADAS
jgi:hypothetical protein